MSQQQQQPMVIEHEMPASPVTVECVPRTIRMYSVSDQELDAFASAYTSLNGVFFGFLSSAAIAFLIVVLTADLTDRPFATFIGLLALTAILDAHFGLQAFADHRRAVGYVNLIRRR